MKRAQVWFIALNPTEDSEQKGFRPAVIISADSMNDSLDTKVVIPLTTKKKAWPSRVNIEFLGKEGQAMCEQVRTVSSKRFQKYLGDISTDELVEIMGVLSALYTQV